MISDEAVEAAFRELPDGAGVYVNRDDLRVMLEAAAPHLTERAYNAGHLGGMIGAPNTNPYRSQA